MDKALQYMGLARKAGRIELGEEPVGAAARAQTACLVTVAQDASDHTWRRAKSFVSGSTQQCLRLPFTKEQLGMAVGRTSLAMAAFTDPALALAFVKALEMQVACGDVQAQLQDRVDHLQQRRNEAKASQRNRRSGRSGKKKH